MSPPKWVADQGNAVQNGGGDSADGHFAGADGTCGNHEGLLIQERVPRL